MGSLHYGHGTDELTIPDDVLAHLRVVVTTKLRRRESFLFTWDCIDGPPPARTTLWLQPAIPLRFTFDAAEAIELDRASLQTLADAANSNAGMALRSAETDHWPSGIAPSATAA